MKKVTNNCKFIAKCWQTAVSKIIWAGCVIG